MDSHNVGRGRESQAEALRVILAKTLTISIETDILFPLREQQFIATYVRGAVSKIIHSDYGHDGFLLEYKSIGTLIKDFIQKEKVTKQIEVGIN